MSSNFTDTPIQVRWSDIDALNHVNNAFYLSYFELGRLHFLTEKVNAEFFKEFSMVVARIEIDYLVPITMGDRITCRTWINHAGNTSLIFGNLLFRDDKEIISKGKVIAVFLDRNGQKSMVPQEIRNLVISDSEALP